MSDDQLTPRSALAHQIGTEIREDVSYVTDYVTTALGILDGSGTTRLGDIFLDSLIFDLQRIKGERP